MPPLTLRELNRATLARQLLLERASMPVAEAVHALGALQAQRPRAPHVALAARLDDFERERVGRRRPGGDPLLDAAVRNVP